MQVATLTHEDTTAHNTYDQPDNVTPARETVERPGGQWTQVLCSQDSRYGGWDGAANAFYEPSTQGDGMIYINLPKFSVIVCPGKPSVVMTAFDPARLFGWRRTGRGRVFVKRAATWSRGVFSDRVHDSSPPGHGLT